MMIFVFDRIVNIVGKGENADYQHFSPFPTMFSKGFLPRVVKSGDCVVKSHITSILSFANSGCWFRPLSLFLFKD